ncbi:MAG TPA: hypothetical protein VG673_01640 [Actinomycetota bacterium]|nr:hypothetical protein [Actinomycetota bacterium]
MDEQPGLTGDEPGVAGPVPGSRQRWRTILAVVLIVVGCVLAPLAGVAVWARNQVTNTDRYVRTVAPLATDPAIQQAVADQITTQIFTYLDVQGVTNQAVDALAARGLRPQLADRLRGFAGPLASGIQSQAFADAWTQANRVAHQALVKALTGQGDGAVTVEGDTISLNLAPFIETVKQRLVEGGFGLAARIPEVNASFVLFDVKDLTQARSAFDLLNTLGIWLPIIAIVLLGIGVFVAKDHRRALVGAAVGVAVAMVGLGLALAVFRTIYLDALPAAVLPHDAAAVLYDTIVAYLRLGLRTVLVLALVVAAGAFLTGQSATALRTRQRLTAGIGRLRGGATQAGWRTGPVGTWVYTNKKVLRIAAVTLAALALVFWGQPTGKTILMLAGLLLVALALIEFLSQPPQPTAASTTQT